MVRQLTALFLALSLLASAVGQPPLEKDKDKEPAKEKGTEPVKEKGKSKPAGLAAGANLPGAFHPFTVTGTHKSKFHCPVSDHGLNPAILVISRELEPTEPFKALLQQLDNAVEKNPNVRLAVNVIFIPDELKDVVTEDDKREELALKLEDLAKGLMLKHTIVSLAAKGDLEKFNLDDNATFTVILYHKLQVQAVEALDRDKLTAEQVQKIIAAVGDKLGARRK